MKLFKSSSFSSDFTRDVVCIEKQEKKTSRAPHPCEIIRKTSTFWLTADQETTERTKPGKKENNGQRLASFEWISDF
jgi:hypothetical protein